jgi:hypothetical protein
MKMAKKNNLILILMSSVVLLFATIGCTKKKFLKYNTIIRLVLDKDFDDYHKLGVLIYANTEDIEDRGDYLVVSSGWDVRHELDFDDSEQVIEIEINWEDTEHNNRIAPEKKISLYSCYDNYWTDKDNRHMWGGAYDSEEEIYAETEIRLKPRRVYEWNLSTNEFKDTGEKTDKKETSSNSNSSNPLSGKWVQVTACSNSAGEKNYFNFSSSSSGVIGQIDCNNSCSDGTVYTQFDYTISGSNVSITPLSVSDFCGISPTLASPFTVPFSISGNTLTLDGTEFQKQ